MKKLRLTLFVLLLFVFQSTLTSVNASDTVSFDNQDTTSIQLENIQGIYQTLSGTNAIFGGIDHEYMETFEDGTYRLNEVINRGEAAKIITMELGISLDSDFPLKAKDVPMSHEYFAEIRKLVELGIIQNDECIRPDEPLKRSEVAVMIALSFNVEVDRQNHKSFKDYSDAFWAKDTIESLADANIIYGTSTSTFSPNDNVTGVQLAFLISRGKEFNDKVNNLEIAYDYLTKDYIPTKNDYFNFSDDVVTYVNIEREKVGLKPLSQDLLLNQLAIIKAQDMINRNYFEHKSPYYGYPWDLATLFDYQYTSLGENIARNYHSPEDVVEAWMESPNHRDNILRESYTNIGIGVKKDGNGNYYWVQMFSST